MKQSLKSSANAYDQTSLLPIKHPRVISLFAGCGGLDLGFHQAGFHIVYANDIELSIKETYEQNLGEIEICDIRKVNKTTLPEADVILAGIPCQPFSNAGNRRSMDDDRGTLFQQVLEVIDIKKPRIVLLENVRGFMSAKDDDGMTMPERLKKEMKKYGYTLQYQLLNAADYEVPQNRHRVVLVGTRDDLKQVYSFPEPIVNKEALTVGNVLSIPYPLGEEHEVWKLSPQSMHMAKFIPEGGSWKDVPEEELFERFLKIRTNIKKYRSPNFYRRFSRNEIMGTITAAATPENSGILHPLEDRRYSIREIARFQSFPDTFKFIGSSTAKKYKMIGNAVPVKFAYHLAKSIKKQVFDDLNNR